MFAPLMVRLVIGIERLKELRDRQEGQALVEYGLILGLVSVVAIGALELVGQNVLSKLNTVANAI